MQAAIATSSVRPYMWIVSGPRSSVPVPGEGMEARLTPATFCPRRATPASVCDLNQDVDGRLIGTALLDEFDREVQIDVVPGCERDGVARVEAGTDELLGAPVLDSLHLGVAGDVNFRSSHTFGIRSNGGHGSPPAGGSQRMLRASPSACGLLKRLSSRSVRPLRSQSRTLPFTRIGRSR